MDHVGFHTFTERPSPDTPLADMPDWDEIDKLADRVRQTPVARDYSRPQSAAEFRLDTALRDIRGRYADLRQRLTARQSMEEARARRSFLSNGRF